ncbi:Zinc finger C2H2 [Penicillium lagena]|uniref:Zinc finger C2H2 n=1 Tax=Penicillium lagena TaxID=94218 RepID=UPI0025415A52|nr:Zinc finger C2H2 [Penicillium lagena]KAJ5619008.1 Zinc finger C2H2 [Penicillium lagena]
MAKRSRSPSSEGHLEEPEFSRSPTPSSTTATPPPAPYERPNLDQNTSKVMHCSLPPHRETLSFASYEDYEVHYRQTHVNRCSECSKNFPTSHLLNIHIEENHDPLFAARKARGEKMKYGCFIETCERKCSTPQKRRLHMIDKHMFPRTYNFYIVNDGIDKQTSLLRPLNSHRRRMSMTSVSSAQEGRLRRRSSASHSTTPVPPPPLAAQPGIPKDMEIDELEKSMSALQFVPTSVTRNRERLPRGQP